MSTKYPSPLLGYNNNVRHKGRVFHIQTEDSGVKYGHIITHLFMDGGRILKSVKTSYAEYIGNDALAEVIREMMKQQHKAMFIALRDGKFDAIVSGSATKTPEAKPPSVDSPPALAPSAPLGPLPRPPPLPSRATNPAVVPNTREGAAESAVGAAASSDPGGSTAAPISTREPPEELTLDIEALERAASGSSTASPLLRAASDLPPPPPNLFREKTAAGKYQVTPSPPDAGVKVPSRPPARAPAKAPGAQPPARRAASAAAGGERRYAPTRPASIFGQARPQQGKSLFGEDLIGDKSLDEVILSYLAEDLEEKK